MFMAKRVVHRRYAGMYGRITKLYWNENKCTREVTGATWKQARTGARKNAVVPKAFRHKRKGEHTMMFAAEAIGRLRKRIENPVWQFASGWLDRQMPKPPDRLALPGEPSKSWGTSKFLAQSDAVLQRRQ